MHDKGITVRQLAEETGYAISTVSQTINGRYSRRNYQAIVSRINRVLGTEGLPERIHTPSDEWCQSVKIGLIRKNMSVSQLAEASGVTRDKMSHVINGRMMDCQVVDTVSRLLGIALPGQLQECLNSMYNEDIRGRLVKKGVPEGEVAFIHSANTDARKSELFAKVRSGQVRFLLGSTQKMGGEPGPTYRAGSLPSIIWTYPGARPRRNVLDGTLKNQ